MSEAYEVLSDRRKRQMYDLGQRSPNNPFAGQQQQQHGAGEDPFKSACQTSWIGVAAFRRVGPPSVAVLAS